VHQRHCLPLIKGIMMDDPERQLLKALADIARAEVAAPQSGVQEQNIKHCDQGEH
jgi:hypothetical protein